MSEEKEKPKTLTIKITIPTKETIASALKQMFPFIELDIEEEKKPEEAPPVKPEG